MESLFIAHQNNSEMCIAQVFIYCLRFLVNYSIFPFLLKETVYPVPFVCVISCETCRERVSTECVCEVEPAYVVNYLRGGPCML